MLRWRAGVLARQWSENPELLAVLGDDLVAGLAPDAAAAVWAARDAIRSSAAAARPERLAESARWWDRVLVG